MPDVKKKLRNLREINVHSQMPMISVIEKLDTNYFSTCLSFYQPVFIYQVLTLFVHIKSSIQNSGTSRDLFQGLWPRISLRLHEVFKEKIHFKTFILLISLESYFSSFEPNFVACHLNIVGRNQKNKSSSSLFPETNPRKYLLNKVLGIGPSHIVNVIWETYTM